MLCLSATVELTSGVPALAYDGGGGEFPEELEILNLENEAVDEDLGSAFDALEEDIVEDEGIYEVEENAEFESSAGGSIGINDNATNADFYVVNGGVATKKEDEAVITVPTEQDFVIYIVPKAGYDWVTSVATVTLGGRYTDKDGGVHNIADASSITNVLSEYDVVDNGPTNILLQENLTAASLYWNKARMVTISSSFLEGFENKGTASVGYADVAIKLTTVDPTTVSYDLPIYVYDNIFDSVTYQQYSQVTRMTTPQLTYGTLVDEGTAIDISNAMAEADWEKYTWSVKLSMLNKDLSGDIATSFAASANSTAWATDKSDGDNAKYFYDASTKKISINALSTKNGYLENEKSLGTKKFAIILAKTTKAAAATEYKLFAKDTDYVDFSFTDSEKTAIEKQEIKNSSFAGIKVATTAAEADTDASKIGAVVKDYVATSADGEAKDLTLLGSTTAARTLTAAAGSIFYTMGDEEPVQAVFDSGWAIPAGMTTPTADIEITEQTILILMMWKLL